MIPDTRHWLADPGAFLTATLPAVNLVGDGLCDLLDPRPERRL